MYHYGGLLCKEVFALILTPGSAVKSYKTKEWTLNWFEIRIDVTFDHTAEEARFGDGGTLPYRATFIHHCSVSVHKINTINTILYSTVSLINKTNLVLARLFQSYLPESDYSITQCGSHIEHTEMDHTHWLMKEDKFGEQKNGDTNQTTFRDAVAAGG